MCVCVCYRTSLYILAALFVAALVICLLFLLFSVSVFVV